MDRWKVFVCLTQGKVSTVFRSVDFVYAFDEMATSSSLSHWEI